MKELIFILFAIVSLTLSGCSSLHQDDQDDSGVFINETELWYNSMPVINPSEEESVRYFTEFTIYNDTSVDKTYSVTLLLTYNSESYSEQIWEGLLSGKSHETISLSGTSSLMGVPENDVISCQYILTDSQGNELEIEVKSPLLYAW